MQIYKVPNKNVSQIGSSQCYRAKLARAEKVCDFASASKQAINENVEIFPSGSRKFENEEHTNTSEITEFPHPRVRFWLEVTHADHS